MRRKYEEMRLSVLEAMSLVEALIDFGEDAEISDQVFDQGWSLPCFFLGTDMSSSESQGVETEGAHHSLSGGQKTG